MKQRTLALGLSALVLLLTCQACAGSVLDDIVPTAQPTATPAPTPPPADDAEAQAEPPAAGPQTFTAEGVRNDFGSDGAICLVYQPVTLVVQEDGTAELTTAGADIIDHANCTTGSANETWYINGLADRAAQTVTFQTCNFGHFTAAGSLSFAQGVLTGEVSCANKDGVKFIALIVGS